MAIDKTQLFVANTSNVKEMKNGRPLSVQAPKELPNCTIVTLGTAGTGEMDHVYSVTVEKSDESTPTAVGKFVIVAPEILVEEARRTDGHQGKFRLEANEVYTAYELSLHDRLEFCENYLKTPGTLPAVGDLMNIDADGKLVKVTSSNPGCLKVVSVRKMATGAIIKPTMDGLYDGAQLSMIKVEVVK